MKAIETKAMRLALGGKVRVESVVFHDDGRIDSAAGYVRGDSGSWRVEIDGDVTTCNCPYGSAREDAGGHSHDLALKLEAAKQREEQ